MAQALVQDQPNLLNGFDVPALAATVAAINEAPARAVTEFRVHSVWRGGAAAEHAVESYDLGGETIRRRHTFRSDEPRELFGGDTAPNPQEYLFAALNACMLFSYAVKAAVFGIRIEAIAVETRGKLDLRGSLRLAPVAPGCETLSTTVRIKSRASRRELEDLHREILETSPNVFHIMSAIRLAPTLVVE